MTQEGIFQLTTFYVEEEIIEICNAPGKAKILNSRSFLDLLLLFNPCRWISLYETSHIFGKPFDEKGKT